MWRSSASPPLALPPTPRPSYVALDESPLEEEAHWPGEVFTVNPTNPQSFEHHLEPYTPPTSPLRRLRKFPFLAPDAPPPIEHTSTPQSLLFSPNPVILQPAPILAPIHILAVIPTMLSIELSTPPHSPKSSKGPLIPSNIETSPAHKNPNSHIVTQTPLSVAGDHDELGDAPRQSRKPTKRARSEPLPPRLVTSPRPVQGTQSFDYIKDLVSSRFMAESTKGSDP